VKKCPRDAHGFCLVWSWGHPDCATADGYECKVKNPQKAFEEARQRYIREAFAQSPFRQKDGTSGKV
jgi:hypothetical protein